MATTKKSTKEEARDVILGGGSYLLNVNGEQKIFTADNIHEFPSDADLALGNPELEKAALSDIEAEIDRLEAAKKKLEASKKAEATEKKEAAKADTSKTSEDNTEKK